MFPNRTVLDNRTVIDTMDAMWTVLDNFHFHVDCHRQIMDLNRTVIDNFHFHVDCHRHSIALNRALTTILGRRSVIQAT
jgi:hypothetical protein